MAKASRDKGKRGEREVVKLAVDSGFVDARRTAALQAGGFGADVTVLPGVHVEVKRCETLALPKWLRQAESEAQPGEVPIVAFRQSNQPWRAVVPLEWLFSVLAERGSSLPGQNDPGRNGPCR